MSKELNSDSKLQMKQNIKLHRQKLLQYLENTNDTVLIPKIKLVSNDVKKFEPVINMTPKNIKVLTDIHVKKHNTRLSVKANQLQRDVKVKIEEALPLSNVELQLKPIPNIEIKDPESPPVIVKKLKEQLIEELLYDSSSSEETDDNISVGNYKDWNDICQTLNESDVDRNDSSSSSLIEAVKYDKHYQLANGKSKEEPKPQTNIDQPGQKFKKPRSKSYHNAIEQACRSRLTKMFADLKKSCSNFNTNRRKGSKISILLAAKKECDLVQQSEEKLIAEKRELSKSNDILKERIAEIYRKGEQTSTFKTLN